MSRKRKFLRFLFVGMYTKENIPNKKVRRTAILGAYLTTVYSWQVQYYQSKQRAMAALGKSEMNFRQWLRWQDFDTAANKLDEWFGDSSKLFRSNYTLDEAVATEGLSHPTVAAGTTPLDYEYDPSNSDTWPKPPLSIDEEVPW